MAVLDVNQKKYIKSLLTEQLKWDLSKEEEDYVKGIIKALDKSYLLETTREDVRNRLEELNIKMSEVDEEKVVDIVLNYDHSEYNEYIDHVIYEVQNKVL